MSEASGPPRRGESRTSGCVVLVAQHFVPLNVVAAQRALRMARAFLARFERVYVVCGDTRALDPALLDPEYGRDVLEDPRVVRLEASPMLRGYGYGAVPSRVSRLVGGVATRLLCGPGVDWIRPVRRGLRRIPADERVRIVVATGPPFITFGAVTRWAAVRRVPVILDYRDLWTTNPHGPYPAVARTLTNRWLERPIARRAALLTTVSQGCKAALERNGFMGPVRVLYNSPDTAYLRHYRDILEDRQSRGAAPRDPARHKLRVVFAGQVYRNCTFAPLLEALATVPPASADQVEVHYYGDSSAVARAEFQQYGLTRLLTDHGKVSKDESLRAILDADLLLSLIHTDRMSTDPAVTGHLTTKVYDYFLSGVPIVNVGPVNGEINGMAVQCGCRGFYSFPADDTIGLAEFFENRAVPGRLERGTPMSVVLPRFEAALDDILDEAMRGPRTPGEAP